MVDSSPAHGDVIASRGALSERLAELRKFESALLANTLDFIDPTPPAERYMGASIKSMNRSLPAVAGVAVTCQIDTSTPSGGADFDPWADQLDEIAATEEPVIWVVQAVGSRPDHECVLGDGMATTLVSVGCHGAVTNGGVRDLAGLARLGFSAHAAGITPHHCSLRYRSMNEPVEVGGIVVNPGDILHADAEGVVKIPRESIDQLPDRAAKMRACEAEALFQLGRAELSIADRNRRVAEVFSFYGFDKPAEF